MTTLRLNSKQKLTLTVLRLFRQGRSKHEIADTLGITVSRVAIVIARTGIRKDKQCPMTPTIPD